MFFDKVLVENSELRRVWRAGFGRMEDPEGNTSFPNVCSDLNECVGSEDPDPRRRLSLRTSSVLVEGVARIYRHELSNLMEDLSEVDRVMAKRHKRKSTDSGGDTSTDSSNPSLPYDTPEHMRRQITRHSDVSTQRPDNETIASLKAPDLSHPLSSISKSTNSEQSSENDSRNGQSAKRRKKTYQINRSSEYPSSPGLTTDRNSEDPISHEELDLADDNHIFEQPIKDANTEFHSDDKATRKHDQNETEKSSQEENTRESPGSPTFTEKFDFVAALPNYDPDTANPEIEDGRTKSKIDKTFEELINEADTRNKFDKNVTIRKKVITAEENASVVRRSDRNDAVKDSDKSRVDLSPILLDTARVVLRSSRQDMSTQRPDNETIASLKAPDLSHPLSSISKSTNSQRSSQNDVRNGQSAKKLKKTHLTNRSSEYPSSSDLTSDRNSEDPISDEEPDLANDNDIIFEQPTKDTKAEFHSDDKATRKSDQNETDKSSQEENARESSYSPTFTDFVAEIDEERTKSMIDKTCEEIINEADTRNKFDENVTIMKKTSEGNSNVVRRSDQNDVVIDSHIGRVDLSPILPSTARKVLRKSRRGTKNINRSVVKKDQATQMDDFSFHPNTIERDRSAMVNLPFGYLLIHDTYRSRYPSKIVLSSLNPFVGNL